MKKINNIDNKIILITGASGFIGSFLCNRLLNDTNSKIIGLDNMNDYYDVKLKEYRLNKLKRHNNFVFIKGNIADKKLVNEVFKK